VSGTVLVNDQPAEGVYVIFHTVGQPPGSVDSGSARTDKDGAFSLVVAEPGEAAITVFWPEVKVENGETFEGADLFGGRYRDPNRPVSKTVVHKGKTVLPPITLTKSLSVNPRAQAPR
jgi:hypothetical protein